MSDPPPVPNDLAIVFCFGVFVAAAVAFPAVAALSLVALVAFVVTIVVCRSARRTPRRSAMPVPVELPARDAQEIVALVNVTPEWLDVPTDCLDRPFLGNTACYSTPPFLTPKFRCRRPQPERDT